MKREALAELKTEIDRLALILLQLNRKYQEREAYVRKQHAAGKQNYSGDLSTVLDKDPILVAASGGAKTVAMLISGMKDAMESELIWRRLQVNLPPDTEQVLRLEPPIATRPQDWAEPARRIVYGEREGRA